ncbi:MAG: DUF2135 domain-containing protein [Cocleimonas sp.]|nr:DUF2135 domain-containing protein [Cocleimonas sp.]
MKKILFIISLLLFSSTNVANTPQAAMILPAPMVKIPAGLKPIHLTQLNVETDIVANIATSTYEFVFHNPNHRPLEGELVFSLFEGQHVVDYALQINGRYRQASVVPKAKAKEAFENTIRAKIDPAVIEKTIGNNFKTRLYPLPAKGDKRIKITLQEVLESKNAHFQYRIPFVNSQPLEKLSLHINLLDVVSQPISNYAGMTFDKTTQGQYITFKKANAVIKQPITLQIKQQKQPSTFFQTRGKDGFIYTTLTQPKSSKSEIRERPKHLAILWNTSHSNQDRNKKKDLNFLNQLIQTTGKVKIQLIAFSNNSQLLHPSTTFCAEKVSCPEGKRFSVLRNQLNQLHFDGTSDYSKLNISALSVDEVLLFSNGIKTLFDAELKGINKPITVINSALKADTNLLMGIARQSKGRFIDMSKHSAIDAFQQFLNQQNKVRVLSASKNIKRENIFTSLNNNRLTLIAKTDALFKTGWITVELTEKNKKTQKVIRLANATPVKIALNSLWGAQKINELSANYKKNKPAMIRLAQQHKVLTRDMSLIVLDRVEDYVRYEIMPPHGLRQRYTKLLALKKDKTLYEKEQALIESIQLLQTQKIWYNKTFPKSKPAPIKKKTASKMSSYSAAGNNSVQMAPRAAPAMEAQRQFAPRAKIAKKESKKVTMKASITLKSFNPNAAYIQQIKAQPPEHWLKTYYKLKLKHNDQPMFYVDVADLFYKNKRTKEAVLILSNLLELDFENSEFLRVFALKAMEIKAHTLAIRAFEKVKELRPFEPQSFRDLALAYNRKGEHQKAADLLYSLLLTTWDSRFSGVKIIIINELNNILALHTINKSKFDPRLISPMPVDLRIVINWSSDNSDIDLWVIDPYGEKTFYSNKVSRIGGKISNDITRGYGPEEFMIRDAVAGTYKIQVNYYGSSQQKRLIPVTLRAEIYSAYSHNKEIQKELVIRLKNNKEVVDIGEYHYEK